MNSKHKKKIKDIIDEYSYEWKNIYDKAIIKNKKIIKNNKKNIKNLPKNLKKYIFDSLIFYKNNPAQLKNEILCGISIAVMQVPESIAFAFVAGISPVQGLYSTFFICLFGGTFTSLPGIVSGIAGGMAAIISEITSNEGPLKDKCLSERVEYVFGIMVICSIIQLIIGILNITKFIKLIPHSVMVGFMNGLAIIIFKAQLSAFQVNDNSIENNNNQDNNCPVLDYKPLSQQRWLKLNELETWLVIIIVFISMMFMVLQPKIKKRLKIWKFSLSAKIIPPALSAMIVTTLIGNLLYNKGFNRHIKLIGDIATFPGNLPIAKIPNIPWNSPDFWLLAIKHSPLLAIVGLIESIMTWQLCQRIINVNLSIKLAKYEAYSQGIGNLFSSFFGSIGGSVMVGQSIVNYTNGGRGRLSTTIAAFTILIVVSVAGKIIELIPIATLTGILFVVVIHTFEWKTIQYILKLSIPITDIITIILVTILAIITDLAIAVLIGVCWCSVVFAWKSSNYTKIYELLKTSNENKNDKNQINIIMKKIKTKTQNNLNNLENIIFNISGSLFFGSSTDLIRYFTNIEIMLTIDKYDIIIIDFNDAIVYDSSGIEFLKFLVNEISLKKGKHLIIINLDKKSLDIVNRSKSLKNITIEIDNINQELAFEFDINKLKRSKSLPSGWVNSVEEKKINSVNLYEESIENDENDITLNTV